MKNRFIALFLIITLLLPLMFISVEAKLDAQNPFDYYDEIRVQSLAEAVGDTPFDPRERRAYSSTEPGFSVTGNYIVKFKADVTVQRVYDIVSKFEFTLLADSSLSLFSINIQDKDAFLQDYSEDIEYIEATVFRSVATLFDDPFLADSWEYQETDIFTAWEYTTGIESVMVAVLDTGIDRRHTDFQGSVILPGYDVIRGKTGVNTDTNGHGTKVSGLISATANNGFGSAGVSPHASLLPIRVTDRDTVISSANLVSGIYFAVSAGAKIINMSLGGYSSSVAEEDAINYAISKGCILIASSGNDGAYEYGGDNMYPASYEGVISVGSVDEEGKVSAFSQHNNKVSVVAPGEQIPVMVYEAGISEYRYEKGTSFSAAIVSGIAVLAVSYLDSSVPFGSGEFYSLIKTTGKQKRDNYYGHGIINAAEILQKTNLPIITGVYDGETYYESVVIGYNRGVAYLDGERIHGGKEVVYEHGRHVLEIEYGNYHKTITFNLDNKPLTYKYNENPDYATFTFDRGRATLDGFPYSSGQRITDSGEHIFELTGEFSGTVTKTIRLSYEIPEVFGVEDGGLYNTAVAIKVVGEGTALMDGKPFEGKTVEGRKGEHTLTVYNGTKSQSRTYNFVIANDNAEETTTDLADPKVVFDSDYGYFALYSESLSGLRVYDVSEPGKFKRFLNIGKVKGFGFYSDKLVIFHSDKITVLNRNRMLESSAHIDKIIEPGQTISDFALKDSVIYYSHGQDLYKRGLGDPESIEVFKADFDINRIVLGKDNSLYLFNTTKNIKEAGVYKEDTGEVFYIDIPVSAFGKKIIYGDGMFMIGNVVIHEDTFQVISENSIQNPLAIREGYLISDTYIIDIGTNRHMAAFPGKVSDFYLAADNTVYIFYSDKRLVTKHNTSNPFLDLSPSAFMAAPCTEILVGSPLRQSEYTSFSVTVLGKEISDLVFYNGRAYALCKDEPALYILDLVSLSLIDRVDLRFIPKEIEIFNDRLYVSFKQFPYLYTAGVTLADFGVYLKLDFPLAGFSISGNKLATLREGRVYLLNIDTLVGEHTSIVGTGVAIHENNLYIASGSGVTSYGIDTLAQGISFNVGETVTKFDISNNYLFSGNRLLDLQTGDTVHQSDSRITATNGNTLITKKGVFDIAASKYISSFPTDGTYFHLDYDFNYYIANKTRIVRVHNPSKADLTTSPVIFGVEEGRVYTDGITIDFPVGIGFIDGDKVVSGSPYYGGGDHVFTLVLPCNIKSEISFSVAPPLEGLEIIGGNRSINVGESINLGLRFLPLGTASAEVVFETRDIEIITLNQNGTITGLKPGIAKVTVYTLFEDFSAECVITVDENLLRLNPSSGYKLDRNNGLISGIAAGTDTQEIKDAVTSEGTVIITDKNGKEVTGIAGSGNVLVLQNRFGNRIDEVELVVRGDISSDGFISAEDLYCMIEILEGDTSYKGGVRAAADINENGVINNTDLSRLKAHLLGYGDLIPEKAKPPISESKTTELVLSSRIIEGEIVLVTVLLQDAKSVYGLSGKIKFPSELMEYKGSHNQNREETVYYEEGDILSFISLKSDKQPSDRSTKTIISFEFLLKDKTIGNKAVFEALDFLAVSLGGITQALPPAIAERTINGRKDDDFNIKINNAEGFFFSEDVYEYEITVDHTVAVLDIETDYPKGGRIFISDTVIPDSDRLSVSILYIDPDGNSHTYYIGVIRKPEVIKSDNNYLSDLIVEGFDLTPVFDREITEYTLSVDYNIEKLSILYSTESESTGVILINPVLVVGENIVKIVCTAENGDTREYTIKVARQDSKPRESDTESDPQPIKKEDSNLPLYLFFGVFILGITGIIIYRVRKDYLK